ncbi:hypothetical protein HPB47_007767 [Ixodes persulcatus]|uniref:Uncharacterized protein n=1 Tax=Ixodes persulcatus TaxID=34615 RepID=A0AC60P6J3_IXOPE|nr:hypothetical protein HPB47_007767 [Ixodes persulcatus]
MDLPRQPEDEIPRTGGAIAPRPVPDSIDPNIRTDTSSAIEALLDAHHQRTAQELRHRDAVLLEDVLSTMVPGPFGQVDSGASTSGASTSGTKKKGARVHWSESETWALIRLWEDNIGELRRQRRNAGVYEIIRIGLESVSIPKTQQQVHDKIDNLNQTYR